jgi:hypothetical protein
MENTLKEKETPSVATLIREGETCWKHRAKVRMLKNVITRGISILWLTTASRAIYLFNVSFKIFTKVGTNSISDVLTQKAFLPGDYCS